MSKYTITHKPAAYDDSDPFRGVDVDTLIARWCDAMRHVNDAAVVQILRDHWSRQIIPHLSSKQLAAVDDAYVSALKRLNV